MKKRLQVLVDDADLQAFERIARSRRLTTAEWVRQSLRTACDPDARPDSRTRLAAIQAAAALRIPVGGIDEMLAEIEAGHLGITLDGGR